MQQYFSSMISTEIITATLAREEAILYIESHGKVIYGIETMALKYTHVRLRTAVYTVKLEQVAEPLTYAPENNLYRTTLSLFYFFSKRAVDRATV